MSEMIALGTKLGRYEIRSKIGAGGMRASLRKPTGDYKSGVKPPQSK